MRRKKQYIKKEKKWNVIFTLITIVIVMIVIAIIELLPGRVPELGYSDMNGVGRSFYIRSYFSMAAATCIL